MPISITNSFTAGSPAIATQVNTNFNDVKTYIDTLVPKVNDAVFTVFPELPASGVPTSVQATPRSYVDAIGALGLADSTTKDNAVKASNTGFRMVSGANTVAIAAFDVWQEVLNITYPTAVPLNATNNRLYLTAFSDVQLYNGNGAASFSMRVYFSKDNGATWGGAVQTSGYAGQPPGAPNSLTGFAGMALTAFDDFTPLTAPTIRVKIEVLQRASFSTLYTSETRCRLAISREVPFA